MFKTANVMGVELSRLQVERRTDYAHEHARSCRKQIDDCAVCYKNIAWFRAMPLHVLSHALAERANKRLTHDVAI